MLRGEQSPDISKVNRERGDVNIFSVKQDDLHVLANLVTILNYPQVL